MSWWRKLLFADPEHQVRPEPRSPSTALSFVEDNNLRLARMRRIAGVPDKPDFTATRMRPNGLDNTAREEAVSGKRKDAAALAVLLSRRHKCDTEIWFDQDDEQGCYEEVYNA